MQVILILLSFWAFNARGIGLAGSLTGSSAGPQTGYYNPAMLSQGHGTSLSILFAGELVGNSAFSITDINEYFQKNKVLNEYDKRHLLYRIGNKPLNIIDRTEISLLGFKTSGFSIALEGLGEADLNLYREIFEIALNGAGIGDTFHFTNLTNYGSAYASLDLAFSHGFNTMQLDPLRKFFFGIGFKALRGIVYANVDHSDMTLSIDSNYIHVDGNGRLITSMGGTGMALDIGIGFEAHNWYFGLSIQNLYSKIHWSVADSAVYFLIESDSFTVADLINNPDTVITDSSWAEPIEPFDAKLPRTFRAGISTHFYNGKILAFADFVHRSSKFYNENKLGLATELRFVRFLPLRFGIALTNRGNYYTTGLGVRISSFSIDLGMAFYRGLFNGAKGLKAGVELGVGLP